MMPRRWDVAAALVLPALCGLQSVADCRTSDQFRDVFTAGNTGWFRGINEPRSDAAVWFDTERPIKKDEVFYLMVSPHDIRKGTVTRIKDASSFGGIDSHHLSAALLKLDHPIRWKKDEDYPMVLAFRGHRPDPARVRGIDGVGAPLKSRLSAWAKALLPGDNGRSTEVFDLTPQGAPRRLFLIQSEVTTADRAVVHTLLLVQETDGRFELLDSNAQSYSYSGEGTFKIARLISFVDVDGQGSYDVLAETWGADCEPCFSLHRFDGIHFERTPLKVLFGWLHC